MVVVDDDAGVRALVRRLIAEAGHEVVADAPDGVSAIACVASHSPDLVVMDWQMPGLDGVGATSEIHARWPAITVIAFSSAYDAAIEQAFLAAGAARHVDKARPDELVAALRERAETPTFPPARQHPPEAPRESAAQTLETELRRWPALARTHVALRGALVEPADRRLLAAVAAQAPPGDTVILDLSDVTAIDPAGLAALEQCGRSVAGASGRMEIHDPSPVVRRALRRWGAGRTPDPSE